MHVCCINVELLMVERRACVCLYVCVCVLSLCVPSVLSVCLVCMCVLRVYVYPSKVSRVVDVAISASGHAEQEVDEKDAQHNAQFLVFLTIGQSSPVHDQVRKICTDQAE